MRQNIRMFSKNINTFYRERNGAVSKEIATLLTPPRVDESLVMPV